MADVLVYVTDLIFSTRITSTASGLDVPCRTVRTVDDAAEAAATARLVLVDLTADGAVEAIERVKATESTARVVAFAPHVDAELIERARAAGADEVLARSAFVQRLSSLLDADAAPS